MLAPHPYRTPDCRLVASQREPIDPLEAALSLASLFLIGWSLLRVAFCAKRGLDLDGCLAVTVLIGAVSALINAWSRLSWTSNISR